MKINVGDLVRVKRLCLWDGSKEPYLVMDTTEPLKEAHNGMYHSDGLKILNCITIVKDLRDNGCFTVEVPEQPYPSRGWKLRPEDVEIVFET